MKGSGGWRRVSSPAVLFLCFLSVFPAACGFLFRDLWFDEALTVLNFASLESCAKIYRAYVIPNNQILYSIALHFWMGLCPRFFPFDAWLRLLSLFSGIFLVFFLWKFFHSRIGKKALLAVLCGFLFSVPFGIYATAIRGYAASALFVVLTLAAALRFAESGSPQSGLCYFLGCAATLGTIPSNLAALAGTGLYVMPILGKAFYRRPRFYALALFPFAAGLLFYLPIWPQFLGVTKLREGWSDGSMTLLAAVLAVLWSFGPLCFLALPGLLHRKWRTFWRGLIWLVPVPAALLLPTAPFPRCYFPMFPLFLLLIAGGLHSAAAWLRMKKRPSGQWTAPLLLAVLLWSVPGHLAAPRKALSRLCGGSGRDDFFFGHYLRDDFRPSETASALKKYAPAPSVLYHSFASDPWALIFALRLQGLTPVSLFDGPRGTLRALPGGTLLILRAGEDPGSVARRFSGRAEPLFQTPMHDVYRFLP